VGKEPALQAIGAELAEQYRRRLARQAQAAVPPEPESGLPEMAPRP
jgi:hypothetical protein